MKIEDVRRLLQRRANDGFFDVAIKFTNLDDLDHVVDELEKGGYQLGLRFKVDDHLYISWGRRSHFKDRWIDNLNDYMK